MIGQNVFPVLLVFLASVLQIAFAGNDHKPPFSVSPKQQKAKLTKLPPCKSCSTLVESFKKGLDRTSRGKHAGGDAAWEEEKLRSYKTSEVRLVEIQEQLCTDVERGQDQCHNMSNDQEHMLEDWFLHKQTEYPNLHDWLCIEQLKLCCPPDHYGPECKKCQSCSGNGICKGNGTRKGNGSCTCEAGYTGDDCSQCALNYYEAFRDSKNLLCSECHTACERGSEGGCSGAGPKGCRKCKNGWRSIKDSGCTDINECLDMPKTCTSSQFCVNNEGSYSCLDCDRSCNGCDGDGPDMCKACAKGYKLTEGKCQDESDQKRDQFVNLTRFLTYLGLCVATCVIFQSSTHIAYIVGAAVAIYIAVSEYWLNSTPARAGKPTFDTKQLEDMIMKAL